MQTHKSKCVALTSDMLTSIITEGFVSVTVHFCHGGKSHSQNKLNNVIRGKISPEGKYYVKAGSLMSGKFQQKECGVSHR